MKPAAASLCSSIHDLAAARSGSGWVGAAHSGGWHLVYEALQTRENFLNQTVMSRNRINLMSLKF